MCISIDVYDIKKARYNCDNFSGDSYQKALINRIIKITNEQIEINSKKGKTNCTCSFDVKQLDIENLNLINSKISKKIESIFDAAGYWVRVNCKTYRDGSVSEINIIIDWSVDYLHCKSLNRGV